MNSNPDFRGVRFLARTRRNAYLTEFRKCPGSLFELPEGVPEMLGFVGRGGKILVVHGA